MDLFFDILLWLHIVAFISGGANSVVMPVIDARLHAATPETQQALFSIANVLARVGKVAMVVLLVTGPTMMWVRYGGLSSATIWFWVKMALIVTMLVSIIIGGSSSKKFQNGDAAAAETAATAGKITGVAFLGVLLSAVFAFN